MTLKYSPYMTDFDKVTIITGGSKGIGKGCAQVFVAAGAPVVICARGEEGKALATELTEKGPGTCHFVPCDVTKPDEIKHLIARTIELHGRIDCLINNAGWHPDKRPIDDFSIEEFEDLFRLNLLSYFVACKYALPYLRKTQGCVINIGSLVGDIGQEWSCTYVATKGGISAFTKALAVDEARHKVRVNCVLPGVIHTASVDWFIGMQENPQAYRDYLYSWQWMGRAGTLNEVGHTCLFLSSNGADFITGAEVIISGGAELAYGSRLPRGAGTKPLDQPQ